MINCLIWKFATVKLKYNDINIIKAICGNPTPSLKMEIRLVYTEGDVCKDTKNNELQNLIVACFNLSQLCVGVSFCFS